MVAGDSDSIKDSVTVSSFSAASITSSCPRDPSGGRANDVVVPRDDVEISTRPFFTAESVSPRSALSAATNAAGFAAEPPIFRMSVRTNDVEARTRASVVPDSPWRYPTDVPLCSAVSPFVPRARMRKNSQVLTRLRDRGQTSRHLKTVLLHSLDIRAAFLQRGRELLSCKQLFRLWHLVLLLARIRSAKARCSSRRAPVFWHCRSSDCSPWGRPKPSPCGM